MLNKARSTRTSAHLDNIEPGCIIDGSHSHPDDFSVAVIRYAETLGMPIEDADLVHVLIRECDMQDRIFADNGEALGDHCQTLHEISDEAVNWLNEHVVTGDFAFHVEESDLFLSPLEDVTD